MKNLNFFKAAGRPGYIILPRRLLDFVFKPGGESQPYRVYLYMLCKAAYYDGCVVGGWELKRGELFYTARTMGEKLHIDRRTVAKILQDMAAEKLIDIRPSDGPGKTSRIRMLYYDRLCTFAQSDEDLLKKAVSGLGFYFR